MRKHQTSHGPTVRTTFPTLTPAELRLVVGGIPGVRGNGSGGGTGFTAGY